MATAYRLKKKEAQVWLDGMCRETGDVAEAVPFVAMTSAALFLLFNVERQWEWDIEPFAMPHTDESECAVA